jgi:hypothetical protein
VSERAAGASGLGLIHRCTEAPRSSLLDDEGLPRRKDDRLLWLVDEEVVDRLLLGETVDSKAIVVEQQDAARSHPRIEEGQAIKGRLIDVDVDVNEGEWVQIYFADGILGILRMKDETKGP